MYYFVCNIWTSTYCTVFSRLLGFVLYSMHCILWHVWYMVYFMFCIVSMVFSFMYVRVCILLYEDIVCTVCCVYIVLFIVWCLLCIVWYCMVWYCIVRHRLSCLYPVFVL